MPSVLQSTVPNTLTDAHRMPLQVTAEDLSANGMRTVLEIDALGTFSASKAAFNALKASGGGVVINVSATLHYGATWWQVWTVFSVRIGRRKSRKATGRSEDE